MTSPINRCQGFVGQSVLRELVQHGERVIAVSRQPRRNELEKSVSWRLFPKSAAGWSDILQQV